MSSMPDPREIPDDDHIDTSKSGWNGPEPEDAPNEPEPPAAPPEADDN